MESLSFNIRHADSPEVFKKHLKLIFFLNVIMICD